MDKHEKAANALIKKCESVSSVLGILTYGSFARGDYCRTSDIDLAIFLDSRRFSGADAKRLIMGIREIQERHRVVIDADFILDSEIELFNQGILLDGHTLSDIIMYKSEGRVVHGQDLRNRFRIPKRIRRLQRTLFDIIEEHFKRWVFHNVDSQVPAWFPGWAITTALNVQGILDVKGREDMMEAAEKAFPFLKQLVAYQRFKQNPKKDALNVDEFLSLLMTLKQEVGRD